MPDDALVVSPRTRGVRFAVLALEGTPAGSGSPAGEVVLENRGCRFVPHVLAVRVGAELVVVNADPVLHNVKGRVDGHRSVFNVVQPSQGQVSRRAIKVPGVLHVTCDTHPHMSGYVVAFEHPHFAVSDADGRFAIRGVPAGRYRLTLWHEGWLVVRRDEHGRIVHDAPRILAREVAVPETGTVDVDFELSAER